MVFIVIQTAGHSHRLNSEFCYTSHPQNTHTKKDKEGFLHGFTTDWELKREKHVCKNRLASQRWARSLEQLSVTLRHGRMLRRRVTESATVAMVTHLSDATWREEPPKALLRPAFFFQCDEVKRMHEKVIEKCPKMQIKHFFFFSKCPLAGREKL